MHCRPRYLCYCDYYAFIVHHYLMIKHLSMALRRSLHTDLSGESNPFSLCYRVSTLDQLATVSHNQINNEQSKSP